MRNLLLTPLEYAGRALLHLCCHAEDGRARTQVSWFHQQNLRASLEQLTFLLLRRFLPSWASSDVAVDGV